MKNVLSASLSGIAIVSTASAAITDIVETGLGGDAAAIIEMGTFGEDALTFSDRTHQHNGPAFDGSNLLSTSGTNIVPLPSYLIGNDYVRFANNARDNDPYSALISADINTRWYLLIDNRLDGPAGNTSSPNSSDPVLGGSLQWVIDGGWSRVNTGISPDSQDDYSAVDESGDGTGAGQALNQFYSIYSLDGTSTTVSSNGIGGSNMISVVAGQIPEPSTGALGLLAGLTLLLRRRR